MESRSKSPICFCIDSRVDCKFVDVHKGFPLFKAILLILTREQDETRNQQQYELRLVGFQNLRTLYGKM